MKRMLLNGAAFLLVLAFLFLGGAGVSADGPQKAILGRGTPGVIAKFVGSRHVGDSKIFEQDGNVVIAEQGGNVGIGCATPSAALHVSAGFTGGGPILNVENTDATGDIAIDFHSGDLGLIGNIGVTQGPIRFFVLQNNPLVMPLTLAEEGGNVGVGTPNPQSALQVVGYIQLDLTSGPPPPGDCDAPSEHGRMKVDSGKGVLYICVDGGWLAK